MRQQWRTMIRRVALGLAVGLAAGLAPGWANGQVMVIEEDRKLVPSDGAAFDRFGRTVAVSGSQGLIGAPFDDDAAPAAGAAYLYDLLTGTLITKITADGAFADGDGLSEDSFGDGIALAADTALIGAWTKEAVGTLAGAAYTFDIAGGGAGELLLPESPRPFSPIGSAFGDDVALSSDGRWMIIGARGDTGHGDVGANGGGGAAYLFDNELGLDRKIFASDAGFADNFGTAVDISEFAAVVGSPFDNDNGGDSGSAYVIEPATGVELAKLVPGDTAAGDLFGWAVAVSGSIAAIGAPYHDAQAEDAGAVYLYDLSTSALLHKVEPPEVAPGELFGFDLAMSGNTLVAGGGGERAFVIDTLTGEVTFELQPSDPAFELFFGISVAIDGPHVLVGAEGDEENGERAGAAYVFDLSGGKTVRVSSIEAGVFRSEGREGAEVLVTVVDEQGASVAGAEVTVALRVPSGASTELVGETDASGVALLSSLQTAAPPLSYRVCVVDVAADLPYDPSANKETCDQR